MADHCVYSIRAENGSDRKRKSDIGFIENSCHFLYDSTIVTVIRHYAFGEIELRNWGRAL
jgi:hypothetical protein